jgi:23S rRNA (cytosine1962-C5)-methyltransferase
MVRIVDGVEDSLPGLIFDKFGAVLVVKIESDSPNSGPQFLEEIRESAPNLCKATGTSSIVIHENRGSKQRVEPELIFGPACDELILSEGPSKFLIKPLNHFSSGFFIDMREVRSRIRALSSGLKVFNGFCFSGSLGIAALAGGARLVTQVDISKSALNWARQNLELNPISSAQECKFIVEDCLKFMEREVKRLGKGAETYQLVIIDPPTFGSSDGIIFSIRKEFSRLCSLAFSMLDKTGSVIFTTNWREVSAQDVVAELRKAAKDSGRKIEEELPLLPPIADFIAEPLESSSMRGGLVRVGG